MTALYVKVYRYENVEFSYPIYIFSRNTTLFFLPFYYDQ